jgi:hypothetical protein
MLGEKSRNNALTTVATIIQTMNTEIIRFITTSPKVYEKHYPFAHERYNSNMATYRAIQQYIQSKHGYLPKSCWIAHAKELNGLPVKRAWNRQGSKRAIECPPHRQTDIVQAFKHFGMIK